MSSGPALRGIVRNAESEDWAVPAAAGRVLAGHTGESDDVDQVVQACPLDQTNSAAAVATAEPLIATPTPENPAPGKPNAAGTHVQFRGRGADNNQRYCDTGNGTWVTEQGAVLSTKVAGQVPPSAIATAKHHLGDLAT